MNQVVDFAQKKEEAMNWEERAFFELERDEREGRKRAIIGMVLAGCALFVYLTCLLYWVNVGIPSFVTRFMAQ